MADKASSSNKVLLIGVPTIASLVILYYSGLLRVITYQLDALMYFILYDIPRFIMNVLGLYRY